MPPSPPLDDKSNLTAGCDTLQAFAATSLNSLSGRLDTATTRLAGVKACLDGAALVGEEVGVALGSERELWGEAVRDAVSRTKAKWELTCELKVAESTLGVMTKRNDGRREEEGEEEDEEEEERNSSSSASSSLQIQSKKGHCAALRSRLDSIAKIGEEAVLAAATALRAACARTDVAIKESGRMIGRRRPVIRKTEVKKDEGVVDEKDGSEEEEEEEEEEGSDGDSGSESSCSDGGDDDDYIALLDTAAARAHLRSAIKEASSLRCTL